MTVAFILPLHAPLHLRAPHFPHPSTTTKRRHANTPTCHRIAPSTPTPPPASLRPLTGEFAGYEATFSSSGAIIPVPDYYIPEEFREWGIIPSGFECHTSITSTSTHLHHKHLRILPSVSHFGDHIDVEESARSVDATTPGFAVFPDACWVAGNETAHIKTGKLEKWPVVEMFIRNGGRGCGVRLGFNREEGTVEGEVKVVLHDWVGEYADSGVMEGGSGYVSGWVDRGGVVDVEGVWKTEEGETVVEEGGGVALPAGVDVGARLVDGGCLLWAGWVVEEQRLVLRRFYDGDGGLVYSERLALRRE